MGTNRREFLAIGAAAGLSWTLDRRNGIAQDSPADLILLNGKFSTMSKPRPFAEAVSIRAGRFSRVGSTSEVMAENGSTTQVIDLKRSTAIAGLNDSTPT